MLEHAITRLMEFAQVGLLASIGAMAKYLHANTTQGRPFSWTMFSINIVLAFCVGNMAGAFIKETNEFRDGLIMLTGYCMYPVLTIAEARFVEMMQRFKP